MTYTKHHAFAQHSLGVKFGLPRKWVSASLVGAIVSGVAFYVVLTSTMSTFGYHDTELQQELAAVRIEAGSLEAKVTQLQALSTLEQNLPTTEFVTVDQLEYLTATVPAQVGVALH